MSFYNKTARGYNELYEEEQIKKLNLIKSNIKIRKDDLILDVGSGTGLSSVFFDNIIGLEPSFEMLEQSEVFSVQGFAESIPFKDDVFDWVISVTAVHNFNDVEKGLKEIKRVGKSFVISLLKKTERFDEIYSLVEGIFDVKKMIVEEKDIILFLE